MRHQGLASFIAVTVDNVEHPCWDACLKRQVSQTCGE
jgi:hypothetical protein